MSLPSKSNFERLLDFFVGSWKNAGYTYPGPFGPGGSVTGETVYRWDVGGKWLVYNSRLELPGLEKYEVHGGVSFNSHKGIYDAYAANSLGNLMIYEGSWLDEDRLIFNLVYPASQNPSRLVYTKLPGSGFKMSSESAGQDGDFKPYFETEFV